MSKPTTEELEYQKLAGEVRSQKWEPIKFVFWFVSAAAAIALLWWQIPEQIAKADSAKSAAEKARVDLEIARQKLADAQEKNEALEASTQRLRAESRLAQSNAAKLSGEVEGQRQVVKTLQSTNDKLEEALGAVRQSADVHVQAHREIRRELDDVKRQNVQLMLKAEQARGTLQSLRDVYLPTLRDAATKKRFEGLIEEGRRKLAPLK